MKKNILRIVTVSAIFVFGLGLSLSISKEPIRNDAAQVSDNFDDYAYSGNYYSTIDESASEGLTGGLRQALTSLIFPKDWYTYGSSGTNHLSTQLQYADEDPTNKNNMIYFYSRDSVTKNAASSWNREHVWPQSLSNGNFGTDSGAGSDVLHIRPTYNSTNSSRGSLLMANLNKTGPVTYNNMLYGYISGGKFEPLDSVKGDVARIYMYVWTAYYNKYSTNRLNMLSVIESYDTLLKWHTLDKPDVLEGNRNNYAEQSVQKNRNPFVDHPEYAWKIFGNSASSSVKNACMEAYPGDGGTVTPTKNMTSIAVTGTANKTEYYVGESFNPAGLTVTAYYDDGSTKNIPVNNCTWSPNPLTENTTEVTCSYNGFTAKYNGITVIKRDTPGGIYGVEFTNTDDSGTDITASTISSYWKNNTLVDSAKDLVKIFPGAKGLKFGSSKANGSISFVLNNDATKNIINIKIETTPYSGGGSYTAKLDNTVLADNASAGSDFNESYSCINGSTLTISSNGRMYLNSISFEIEQTQPASSSSAPISSSVIEPFSSNPPVASSSEDPSYSCIDFDSSSTPESYADVSSESSVNDSTWSSNVVESSSISSEESVAPLPTTSSSAIDSSEPNNDKKSFAGCSGSVAGITFVSLASALVGIVFIASKKK